MAFESTAEARKATVEKGVDIEYEIHGHGPHRVVLIMGFSTARYAWHAQTEFLASKPDVFTLVTLDNRGTGGSSVPSAVTTTATMAEDAIELLVNELGWPSFHVVGISMGGMIALELAMRVPRTMLESLTVFCTHAGGLRGIAPLKGTYLMARAMLFPPSNREALLSVILRLLYGRTLEGDSPEAKAKRARIRQYHIEAFRKAPKRSLRGIVSHFCAVATHYVSSRRLAALGKSGVPIQVVVGTNDVLVRPSNSHMIARITGAKLVVLDGVGHGIPHEMPDRMNQLISEHVLAHGKAGAHAQNDEAKGEEERVVGKDSGFVKDRARRRQAYTALQKGTWLPSASSVATVSALLAAAAILRRCML